MKTLFSRSLAALFATLLILSLASCATPGNSDTTTEDPSSASTSAPTDETTSLYEEDDLGTLNLNTTIGVLVWSDVEHLEFNDEIGLETGASDLILSKLNSRLETVKKRLGVDIEFTAILGDSGELSNWNAYVEKAINGGDYSFDVIAGYSQSVAQNAASGFLYNLLDDNCHYINFDKPWWSELLVEEATVKGKIFFASGDISRNALEMMYVCYANTSLLEEYNLENPQNYVADGNWTYEKFFSMCDGIYKDLDGDGKKNSTKTDGDQFGYMTSGIHVDPFFYGSGATVTSTDADGNLVVSDSFTGERVVNTVNMLNQFLYNTDDGIYTSSVCHQEAFGQGRVLFMTDRARVSHKILKASYEVDYVVLPCPKYDADQEKYITVMGNPFTLYAIRSDAQNPEAASAFIECMASEGYRQITPAVFELQLKTRYVNDPVSAQMYDLIRSNLTYDLGRLYNRSLASNQTTFRNAIADNNPNYLAKAKVSKNLITNKIPDLMKVYE